MKKLLALNRSEIAIRILRAANELGLRTVAIYSQEDRLALHRFKADEAYLIGEGKGPVEAYLDVEGIVGLAREKEVDAIHPGYGFLSENPALPRACERAGITFIGPSAELLDLLGDKTAARRLAQKAGIPVVPGTETAITDARKAEKVAAEIGFPLIIKAAFGGGGRGMRVVDRAADFPGRLEEARREAAAAFGNDAVFIERFVRRARHIEVQILGDRHGNILHLYERDCSVQRRHQKVVEVAPAVSLDPKIRAALADAAVQLARAAGYYNAGTVEFLVDADSGEWYFIEVNPRIQVEHTVTEMVTGIDLVRSQIQVAQGLELHGSEMNLPPQDAGAALRLRAAMPHHDRRSGQQLRSGLRQDLHLPLARRLRHPARRRLGLQRRGDHAVLRFAAGEDHRLGPRIPPRLPAHGPLPARVPRARREDQHPVPRKRGEPSGIPGGQRDHALAGGDSGAVPASRRAATAPPSC